MQEEELTPCLHRGEIGIHACSVQVLRERQWQMRGTFDVPKALARPTMVFDELKKHSAAQDFFVRVASIFLQLHIL
jgi:hypothetical protein